MPTTTTTAPSRLKGTPLPNLRAARVDRGFSIRRLEEESTKNGGKRVHRRTISDIELGYHGASPTTLKRLADVLEVSPAYLRGEEKTS